MARSRKTAVEGTSTTVQTPPRRLRRRRSDKTSFKRQHHQQPCINPNWREDMDWDRYNKELDAYEGFYLTKAAGICGAAPSDEKSESVIAAANYAIEVYNKKKRPKVAIKLNKVIRSTATASCFATRVHSLTLATSDGRFYETKVKMLRGVAVGVKLFRPAVHYPVREPINMPSKHTYKNTPPSPN